MRNRYGPLIQNPYFLYKVYFKPIPEEVIERLVADGGCLACAGGLMIEHPLVQPYIARHIFGYSNLYSNLAE